MLLRLIKVVCFSCSRNYKDAFDLCTFVCWRLYHQRNTIRWTWLSFRMATQTHPKTHSSNFKLLRNWSSMYGCCWQLLWRCWYLWMDREIIWEVSNYLYSFMISKFSELDFICIIFYRRCVCKPEPPQPPAPSICKKMYGCISDNQCRKTNGDGSFCKSYHPIKLMRYLTTIFICDI